MIDASIPLTVAEWEEWGNPNEGECLLSCSLQYDSDFQY